MMVIKVRLEQKTIDSGMRENDNGAVASAT